jgi:hypothetical protein
MNNAKLYWIAVGKRIIDLCLSFKVLISTSIIIISTIALFCGKMDGVTWATLNGAFITAVVSVREGFKVAKIRALESNNITVEEKTKILEETKA